jgi:hypothetical protein
MSAGSLTMAFLLLAPGQAPTPLPAPPAAPAAAGPAVSYSNTCGLKVPVTIDPAVRPGISQIILYASADKGRTWEPVDRQPPEKDWFRFEAPGDGEYWLLIATVNKAGQQLPENLYNVRPHRKVIIDTRTKPSLRITSARREKDELVVAWEAQAKPVPHDPRSFVLEHRLLDGSSSVWFPTKVESPNAVGEARVRLFGPGPVEVRLQFKDAAGNVAKATASVPGTGGPGSEGVVVAANSSPVIPPPAPPDRTREPPPPKDPGPPPSPPSGLSAPSPVGNGKDPAAATTTTPALPPEGPGGLPQPPQGSGTGAAGTTGDTQPALPPKGPAATTGQDGNPLPAPPGGLPPAGGHRAVPPVQLVNTREVALEYRLNQMGPSGIGSVQLFITRNGGEKWDLFAKDSDTDPRLLVAGKKYKRTLELPPEEGLYGLYLVVHNKAGVGKALPKPGDAPEMLIEVDRTPPEARFWPPEPDPERRDAVVIRWESKDKNPAPNPVTLEWSTDLVKGRWQPIAADLPATGSCPWRVPAGTPHQVFMRLKVRDRAGNESTAVTRTPVTVDLVPPQGELVGVQAVRRP